MPKRNWNTLSGPRLSISMVVVVLGLLFPTTSAQATHSLPQPYLWYWDTDDNGTANCCPTVDLAGNGWTATAIARVDDAIAAWTSNTSFDPVHVVSGSYKVYRDGTPPTECGGFASSDFAVTCIGITLRHLPGAPPDEYYQDISYTATYFKTDAGLPGSIVRYWYGAAQSSSSTDLDFQGVMTHELGHWIYLRDLGPSYGLNCNYGSGIYTMCGELHIPGQDLESFRQRSLTSDDISAANVVY